MDEDDNSIWGFEKLKGSENYRSWSRRMKYALEYDGFWEEVMEEPSVPGMPIPPTDKEGKNIDDEPVYVLAKTAWLKERADWKKSNNKANIRIKIMCEEAQSEAIDEETTAWNSWIKLRGLYQDSGFTIRHSLLSTLFTTTLGSCNNSIEAYVHKLTKTSKDLKRLGAPMEDWVLVSCLLNNLDGKYEDFVQRTIVQRTIVNTETDPKFEEVVQALLKVAKKPRYS